ncbi:flagellar brake protein [Fundidesulfovibrio terrae]|uniref:flagellar brake protein n=1 Tax=Fundidesulfovibrio terrae TaxID=2922866 RepID=UPI001FB003A7|nr:PilZ domain-containing protein [Fundidesulfovibrio terrae]
MNRPPADNESDASLAVPEVNLALSVGQPVSLRTGAEERGGRAAVLGYKPGEFLIVKPSPVQSSKTGYEPDSDVLVSLENDGALYGFEVQVLNWLKHPSPVLILSYPKEVESRALRSHPRIKCLVPTIIEGQSLFASGHIRDISMGGCRIVASTREAGLDRSVKKGDQLDIRLPVDGLRTQTLSAQVRACTRKDGLLNLGMAFRNGSTSSQAVSRFIDHLKKMECMQGDECKETSRDARPHLASSRSMRDATARVGDASQVSLKVLDPLDIQFTGSHLYDQSSILGVDGSETIIAEMPISSGLKNCPKPGMGLRVRFEDHGSHYGFLTSVTKFITKPRPMVFFAYPKKIEILMRRKHPRVKCQLPASLENEHLRMSGYVTDISAGGCRVVANLDDGELICNVMTGDRFNLAIPMEGLRVASLRAQVKSFAQQGNTLSMGLVFGLDKTLASALGEFITRLDAAAR